jgi:hypothetical protein
MPRDVVTFSRAELVSSAPKLIARDKRSHIAQDASTVSLRPSRVMTTSSPAIASATTPSNPSAAAFREISRIGLAAMAI